VTRITVAEATGAEIPERGPCREIPARTDATYSTCRYPVADAVCPPAKQVIVTGQLPGVVLVPTFQVQLTLPLAFAAFGPRPAAVEGPDL
jgi:hypothetical protein